MSDAKHAKAPTSRQRSAWCTVRVSARATMRDDEHAVGGNDLRDRAGRDDPAPPRTRSNDQPCRHVRINVANQLLDDAARCAFRGEALTMRQPVARNRTTAL